MQLYFELYKFDYQHIKHSVIDVYFFRLIIFFFKILYYLSSLLHKNMLTDKIQL